MKKLLLLGLLVLLKSAESRAQATAALPVGAGLTATYYAGMNFERPVVTRIDAAIDFNWHVRPPAPGVPAERFSVRWEGYVLAPVSGEYIFSTIMDDGLRVWLGDKQLLNYWRDQDHVPAAVRIRLRAGRYYRLRVDYFQNSLDSRALLQWQRPDQPRTREPVGRRYLFARLPTNRPAPAAPAVTARLVSRRPATASLATRSAARRAAVAAPAPRPDTVVATAAKVAVAAVLPDTLPELTGLAKGTAVELRKLYFEQGKARLLPTSQPELNRLVRALQRQAALRLEIAGYTDNVGNAAKNLALSQQRAALVRGYLVQHGIDSGRLTAQGYGGTRPVANNADPQQRPRNRRVEVVVR
ncbi:OmpA family protein [Hymenobacter busanensis]|uniref:OmpA family protein n=1 Tax=Hymenobacter busanensis TaxID=2607656 RepID=A0A7L4ZY75_9BACT|nr:PA14 domain-containing protein [Hymenobacter busanensis]KAA9333104.1 OmpA family protein [Hymenobacter busanensis]QHJ08221.1 OmpA family protein [Hymenobacter busanensis]